MDKLEFIFIIIGFICILIQISLSVYEIYLEKQSSKDMKKLLNNGGNVNAKNN